jgi:hypothetical protein
MSHYSAVMSVRNGDGTHGFLKAGFVRHVRRAKLREDNRMRERRVKLLALELRALDGGIRGGQQ